MGYRQSTDTKDHKDCGCIFIMGTVGKKKESHKPAHGCSTIPKLALELKQIIHCTTHPKLPTVTPLRVMMPVGKLAKGASLDDLIQMCIQTFDSDGNLCQSNELLQITLTMHGFLISSTDLLTKLRTLYPLLYLPEIWLQISPAALVLTLLFTAQYSYLVLPTSSLDNFLVALPLSPYILRMVFRPQGRAHMLS
ncbi:RAS guanyl-releasing protein 1-like [Rhinophrynus dorsalis]